MAAQTFLLFQLAKCGLELQCYVDTLNFLYLEIHAFKSNVESPAAVKSSNSIWGCRLEVEIDPQFLFRRSCGNLESHDKMSL